MRTDTRYPMRALRLLLVAGVVGLAGCFSLARTEPVQRHYVLGGDLLQENGTQPGDPAGLVVAVRRLRLASYLEPAFLVVRQGPNEITYSEFHRWGEPLGGGINRAVAGYLAARAPLRGVDVAPWPAREQYDYLIQLHVERFEGVVADDPAATEGEVHLLASWEILRQRDGAVLARGTTDHRVSGWRVGDHAGLVTRLDAGLNLLSQDLATSLSSLGAPLAELR
jgi:uncharacterized lipoprotein YmbA